jgi:hypothetical protein
MGSLLLEATLHRHAERADPGSTGIIAVDAALRAAG